MPEGPELRLASMFINQVAAKHKFSGKVTKSELATKPNHHPDVPFEAKCYTVFAETRGKELKLHLYPQENDEKETKKKPKRTRPAAKKKKVEEVNQNEVKHLLIRFGMSGCFKLSPVDDIPKHAHLRFWCQDKKNVLCFVDYRRFGTWKINEDWGSDRGPDPVVEYADFRTNVIENLEDSAFNRPICETLLNQKFFNGIGNYLRAEILFRCGIAPFAKARDVLEPLENVKKVKTEEPDILELCHLIPKEVLNLGSGKGYDVEKKDALDMDEFNNWLQCYYQDGMNNLVDHNGRTIWFKGPAGPMKPSNAKSRGVKKKTNRKRKAGEDDHDYEK